MTEPIKKTTVNPFVWRDLAKVYDLRKVSRRASAREVQAECRVLWLKETNISNSCDEQTCQVLKTWQVYLKKTLQNAVVIHIIKKH